ncbi:MAG: TraR/DksA family transcriptional regulator [Blastocatellia bacterium]|nr:TraR/DksA family transcriptional regulator [Blastocatellia bacterium]MCS7157340.1 TraR/DksA family transcriptional regulator [Blastocatellia bacterium]MCX7753206.1 TraR/DksA family transcriptional regulator [Blastocatellia bacterium]MDW8168244.1 TraR/DksA family transcriptional regulator [Acidobacteriota bacterium]MDW8255462.1 TraR/DksA family transcriptional regulator [Acidobacteriota bacterium]
MMTKKKVEHYRKRLLEKREELLRALDRHVHYGREADQDVAQDPADKASNSYLKELLFSQSTSDRYILTLIDEALERLAEGTYGICVACGAEIQPKRLEAVPWARHCVTCQDLQERGLLRESER